jgi:hypothetical protein
MKSLITWRLPIKIANEANSSEHWTKKSRRHKLQKNRIKVEFIKEKPSITMPCTCILTRIAPRELDHHDNLRSAMKWVVDSIAEEITKNYVPGRADGEKGITWEYKQVKGGVREYGVLIEFITEN